MAKAERPFAPCKLCGVPSLLQESHIVPRWTYRRAIRTGSGDPNVVTIHDDVARRGGPQLKEFMLCVSCEAHIERWEGYVARVALQEDDSFPALEASKPIPELSSPGLAVVDVTGLNLWAIERFATSVIWRASESQLFPRVSLGARYHREFAAYLLDDEATLPGHANLTVEFIRPGASMRIDRVVVGPHSANNSGYHGHRFSLFGMIFNLMVGNLVPSIFDELALASTRRVLVTDGMQQLGNSFAEQLARVIANGGLGSGGKRKR